MVKKFTIPFASQGDANDIPDALQVDGKVSFTQGFGYDYERPYDDPQAKDIAREDMNGLFKAITSAVGELQTLGASEWSSAIFYPKGAIVYHEKDLYISQVDDNQNEPPQNWVSITSIANDSLKKAANLSDLTNKATARNNLGLGSSATLNKTDVLGTSTSLVATQKLVNDTKINLESSKQDKLTFEGSGNVARMSEVEKKRDLTDGNFDTHISITNSNIGVKGQTYYDADHIWNTKINGSYLFPSKAGTLALTSDIPTISQSTGSSTTSVMSQKAVTDRLSAIESGHGLGYGQKHYDVTASRNKGVEYVNDSDKPIFVYVYVLYAGESSSISLSFRTSGVEYIARGGGYGSVNAYKSANISVVIESGAKYSVTSAGDIENWIEMR